MKVRTVGKGEEVKYEPANFLFVASNIPFRFSHLLRMDKAEGITKA